MAISSDFSTSNQYIKYRIVVEENSTSIANNTSNITVRVQVWRTNSGYTSYGTGTCYCTINGSNYSQAISTNQKFTYNSFTEVFYKNLDIPHNSDGSKTIWVSSYISHSVFSSSSQGFNVTLSNIPRYATSNQSLSGKTETTITMNWWSDNIVDYIWWSQNNGSSWNGIDVTDGYSGSYTISGLSANTNYDIKTRVRRRDSQLTTDSSTMGVSTYDYPHVTDTPNFTVGDAMWMSLYNPLGRTVTATMYGDDNSTIWSATGWTGNRIGSNNTPEDIDHLYRSIPNKRSGTYRMRVVYGSSTRDTNGGTYTVNPSNCMPSINSVSYQDINSTSVAITGNNQNIVRNQSLVRYSASGISSQKYASVSSCSVSVNGNSYTLSLSGSSATGGNAPINSASNVSATFTVTDSRGITASKSINISMLDWIPPSAIITLSRHDNFYSETDIMVDADYSSINGNNHISITYQAKKTTESSYSISGTLQDGITSTFTADNNFDWEVLVTLVDSFQGTTRYNLWLSRGAPIIYFDRLKSSVGVNCFPRDEKSLEVNGVNVLPSVMTRSLSDTLTNLVAQSYTIVPLDLDTAIDSRLIVDSNGGIEIGSGISYVLVSGQLTFNDVPSSASRHIRIVKNSFSDTNTVGWTYNYIDSGHPQSLTIPPILASVTHGDVISLWYYTPDSSDTISGNTFGGRTSLTVQTVG